MKTSPIIKNNISFKACNSCRVDTKCVNYQRVNLKLVVIYSKCSIYYEVC